MKANPDSVVVVDEAYVDFGAESCVALTKQYPNLLVVQTYSKSRSMAGAVWLRHRQRGAHPGPGDGEILYQPYNVNRLTLKRGRPPLPSRTTIRKTAKDHGNRGYTKEKLEKLGFTVLDSKSNFLFAKKPGVDGGAIYGA